MTRENLAEVLDEIALLLELKAENPFKVRAYRQGAETVRNYDGDILQLAIDNQLNGIKGIGDALRDKLHELASTGKLGFHEKLRAEFPAGLFELFDLQGLGPKKIKVLYDTLGVGSIADLKAACDAGTVATLPGFGAKTQTKILESIALKETFADSFLLGGISPLVEQILELLRLHPEISRVSAAGSYRRGKETVHDLDFLVATKEPALVCEDFTTLPQVASVIVCGDTKASVRLKNGLQCDLRAVSNAQFPFALQYFTGSKEHNVAIRSLALKQGLSLNEYGFTPTSPAGGAGMEKSGASSPDSGASSSDSGWGVPPQTVAEGVSPSEKSSPDSPPKKHPTHDLSQIHEEADIYRALGLDYIPPEIRENRGEIEAAADHTLPRLIDLEQLRGTFHNHTTASDGRDTLEAMAEEAMDLGLQYLGIADHSKSSFQADGLDETRLLDQIEAIAKLNATYEKFRLFSGSEVDILKDGTLDFPDEILARLDYCVASVHASFTLSEEEMTRRICRAMENEHVTMLGHVTGRLLLRREPYLVNHAMIIDCAAETRTIIELNCSPQRLDMDWGWWKRARDKGVLCAINPDAHSTMGLHHLGLGIRLARKGWLRKQDVFNTRPLPEVQAFLKLPKSQR